MGLVLVSPNERYKTAFAAMAEDFYAHEDQEKYASFQPALEDFGLYVASRQDEARGIDLQKGYVPIVTYWLTDESDTIYGTIRYRAELNATLARIGGHIGFDVAPAHRGKGYATAMLRLLLLRITPLPRVKLLLTCDAGNVASQKVIEKNGGVQESTLYDTGTRRTILRYRITLSGAE